MVDRDATDPSAADRPGEIAFDDCLKVEIVTGTIVGVRVDAKARIPVFVLDVDFGPHGRKTNSARITGNYTPGTLFGKQTSSPLRKGSAAQTPGRRAQPSQTEICSRSSSERVPAARFSRSTSRM